MNEEQRSAVTVDGAPDSCRGEARKSTPKRSRSKRAAPVAIISMAQQAKPNVIGQRELARASMRSLSSE